MGQAGIKLMDVFYYAIREEPQVKHLSAKHGRQFGSLDLIIPGV
jgi:hypothetical protein